MLKSILLVEDNPNDKELILIALNSVGLADELVTVSDGEEAMDYLFLKGNYSSRKSGNPRLILLDLKLPKIEGFEFLKNVRASQTTAHIPIVILSDSYKDPDILKSYELRANAFIIKPFEFSDLIRDIGKIALFWTKINKLPKSSISHGLVQSKSIE